MICIYSTGQRPRGIKNDKDRPGLIIVDDLENEEQAQSKERQINHGDTKIHFGILR